MSGLKKILRILVISMMICFAMTFALVLINSVMGVHIGLDYYFLMGSVLTVCLTFGIVLCNARKIFDSKTIHKTRMKNVSTNKKQKSHSRDIKR
ncbi:TPA: hypothetical protein JD141_14005, partial [Clostridioides difficile]|nr:hypothetical protein [Clostridioides difficile]